MWDGDQKKDFDVYMLYGGLPSVIKIYDEKDKKIKR